MSYLSSGKCLLGAVPKQMQFLAAGLAIPKAIVTFRNGFGGRYPCLQAGGVVEQEPCSGKSRWSVKCLWQLCADEGSSAKPCCGTGSGPFC